ncbi:MAG: DUF2783 domain-containing protein [Methylotenera sp.]|nr:DUF2783 domain-containing protein [Methylotenera sp.]
MHTLNTHANFHDSGSAVRGDFEPWDAFYEVLMQSHEGLTESQSHLLNARLILVMANHIGHLETLKQAIHTARDQLE